MATLSNDCQEQLQELYDEMRPQALTPLWEVLHALVLPEPRPLALAHAWSYADARAFLMRAGDLISAEKAERRVLILENPGLQGKSSITSSIYAGLQLILPGEIAPCHRHAQCALRFVLEGSGAYTAVDGEKAVMQPFDLVLTPSMQWHDHGNPTQEPMIWMDGLDIPTVTTFDASFAERLAESVHPETAPSGENLALYGHNMRPMQGSASDNRPTSQPLFHYPYAHWRKALGEMARSAIIDPHLGYALEFRNPADGGHVMPTIAAHVRLLPRGFETRPRRSTDGTVFVVVEGQAEASVGDQTFKLGAKDTLVVPSWQPLRIRAAGDQNLVLFGFSDKATQQKINLYRELCE